MLARAALGGIWVYQTYLSPRKGFRCAYSVQHGGTGCSGFAKQAIREHGSLRAIPLIRDRFRACKVAALALADAREDEDVPRAKKRRRDKWYYGCCDGCEVASCCASGARGTAAKKNACDIGPDGCDGPGPCDVGCDGCSCT